MTYLLSFLIYGALLIFIAKWSARSVTTSESFLGGGRSLNYWVTALSAHASDMSSWLFMAFPMLVMTQGTNACWVGFGLVFGMFLVWKVIAIPLRQQSEELNSNTLSDLFAKRFGDDSGNIKRLTGAIMGIFLAIYVVSGLTAMGTLFEVIFNLNYYLGISLCAILVVAYMSFGGYVTVAWTDAFQALFLLCMLGIVAVVGAIEVDLFNGLEDLMQQKELSTGFGPSDINATILEALAWGVGYFGLPHVLTKFIGIENTQELKKSSYLGLSWQLTSLILATIIGLIGIKFFLNQPLDNPELVFVEIVKQTFHPFLGGLILCGLFSASISTMDSQLIVISSILGESFKKLDLAKAKKLSIGVVLITFLCACFRMAGVAELVRYAWFGLGCCIGPLVIAALYFKNVPRWAVYTSISIGSMTAIVAPLIWKDFPVNVPGFFVCLSLLLLSSKLTPARPMT